MMQQLAGEEATPTIVLSGGRGRVVLPQILVPAGLRGHDSVQRYARARLSSERRADEILVSEAIPATRVFGELQLTEKVVLELRLAWEGDIEYVVFSSAGVDPPGMDRIARIVRVHLCTHSAIEVFASSLGPLCQQISGFDRVVWSQLAG
jgi:hypothetical protein